MNISFFFLFFVLNFRMSLFCAFYVQFLSERSSVCLCLEIQLEFLVVTFNVITSSTCQVPMRTNLCVHDKNSEHIILIVHLLIVSVLGTFLDCFSII